MSQLEFRHTHWKFFIDLISVCYSVNDFLLSELHLSTLVQVRFDKFQFFSDFLGVFISRYWNNLHWQWQYRWRRLWILEFPKSVRQLGVCVPEVSSSSKSSSVDRLGDLTRSISGNLTSVSCRSSDLSDSLSSSSAIFSSVFISSVGSSGISSPGGGLTRPEGYPLQAAVQNSVSVVSLPFGFHGVLFSNLCNAVFHLAWRDMTLLTARTL